VGVETNLTIVLKAYTPIPAFPLTGGRSLLNPYVSAFVKRRIYERELVK
jgi:hypothetical protein